MGKTDLRQRLAAILAADVAGYSRLMSIDERATVAALDEARRAFRSAIESHQGRLPAKRHVNARGVPTIAGRASGVWRGSFNGAKVKVLRARHIGRQARARDPAGCDIARHRHTERRVHDVLKGDEG